ncbi:hypothetical protein BCR32DRAFT_243802 [Anaeromyces robustus]|uniref:Uncharacterized protein n=1 Tax=Anaeromyces robustus TaxID=1754192 RepID=A0A1Y1XBY6_9FUNG|nr:hypothetical protein BCR32DRAFT_243802 [Anaeromyces robustus]|eukprot:ORX82946.1 hypothetical protein BCR32DRAFT_243802 [Anaeromyces robustus]
MLTRSKQRLINNENINNENINSLKRKRSTKSKKQVDKENIVPSNIRYSLRSRNKIINNDLKLKPKNENIIIKERKGLKEKLLNNIVNVPTNNSSRKKVLKDHNNNNNNIKDNNNNILKEKENSKIKNKVIVLIENNTIKKDAVVDKSLTIPLTDEPRSKKAKIEKKEEKKNGLILKSGDKQINSNKSKIAKQVNKDVKNEKQISEILKNDQKIPLVKPSITKKKDNNNITKEKKKISFNKKVKENDNSVFLVDSFSSNNDSIHNIKKSINNHDDNHLSSIKEKQKQTNDIIVPFIRLDSLDSDSTSTSTSTEINNIDKINNNKNTLERKFSDLSDKSLEILNDIHMGGGKVQFSSILESLNSKGHLKSSTPNNFNKTLLFLEESPINYTRILNEEMNFHVPLSTSIKSPEKEVSNLSQNTSFQDSNSISNFINISPISNSDIRPTDSDFHEDHIQPCELIDESDLFNADDKSSLYSMDELDEKIKKLLSGNDNFNLVSDDDNNNILRYTPISPEKLNKKNNNKNNNNNNHENKNNTINPKKVNIIASSSKSKSNYKPDSEVESKFKSFPKPNLSSSLSSSKAIKELNYNHSIISNQFNLQRQDSLSSNSSSDDPFGFSKAEKIYKTKQQQIKNGTHTPTPIPTVHFYTSRKESHSLDNANEILMKEHQDLIESRKKNRNRKKLKVEDMEELDSQDLKELKQAKDQQIKYFKEIDDYVLNESIL